MHFICIIVLSLTVLTSCNDDSKVSELENRIKSMEDQILILQKDGIHQKIDSEYDGYTFLDPGDQGFGTIKLDIGSVTVSLKDIQEYANGSKVTLDFGNPHTAQINKVKFDVDYGRPIQTVSEYSEDGDRLPSLMCCLG
jgi:hypothetical protein